MTMGVHTGDKSLVITTEPKAFCFDLPKDLKQIKTRIIKWSNMKYLSY